MRLSLGLGLTSFHRHFGPFFGDNNTIITDNSQTVYNIKKKPCLVVLIYKKCLPIRVMNIMINKILKIG